MIETLKNYLFYLKYQKNYSIKTIDSYQRDIEKFLKYIDDENYTLETVDQTLIRNFLSCEIMNGISKRSNARRIIALRGFYEYLVKNKGLDYGDIAIVFPYNKKKLKNGKTIYFQYLLRKALDDVNIPYIIGDDDLTKHAKKTGITLSNLYFIKNLEYKAVVFCELEMLYNQTINKEDQDYQINDFIGDLNKIYMVID